ncbi:MAG: hypothetical protein JNM76_02555 [Betaproteobacteria bacterium]|nr:hypothetical protein [Betaproteobacteria bacterium]
MRRGAPDESPDHRIHRRRYVNLVVNVAAAINAADPLGLLEGGAPADEYDSEVGTIVPRVAKAGNFFEVRRIVDEEFRRWFGREITGRHTDEVIARAIWEAVLEFRRTH